MQSDEKSVCAICIPDLISASLILIPKRRERIYDMKKITKLFSLCSTITTATLVICTFWTFINTISSGGDIMTEKISLLILPQMLVVGFVTGLGTLIIVDKYDVSKREEIVRRSIHFVFICVVVLGFGAWFEWYKFTVPGVLFMMLSILAVYAATYFIMYYRSKRIADKVNEKLEQMNKDK